MTVHILNGDSLKEQFPDSLDGRIIVAREALVDGPIRHGLDLDALYSERAAFLSTSYGGSSDEYMQKTAFEFESIRQLADTETVYLWFEEDLFCQVNLWFCCWLLINHTGIRQAHLVLAEGDMRYGFAGYDTDGLLGLHGTAHRLDETDLVRLASLWPLYLNDDHEQMLESSRSWQSELPFLTDAVQANADRISPDHQDGRPYRSLRRIMSLTEPCEFGPVFREFWSQESIYGFGDLQVRRMFDSILDSGTRDSGT